MSSLDNSDAIPVGAAGSPLDLAASGPIGRGYSLRHVLRSSALYSVSDVGLKLIGFFLVPLYTRAMTPQDYGIIGYTTAVTQILSPAMGLGLVGSLPVLYFAYQGRERSALVSTVINLGFLYSLLLTIALCVFGQPVFTRLSAEVPFTYVVLAFWALFFSTFYYLPLGIFNMAERTTAYAAYSVGLSLMNVVANIVLVLLLRWGAFGALWANAISSGLGMIVAFVSIRQYWMPVVDLRKLGAILVVALPTVPHLFTGTLWKYADRLFLANKSSLAETGLYTLAMTLASIELIVMAGASTALNPLFYRRAHEADPNLPHDWARLASLFIAAALILGLGLALLGGELIRLMTPPRYHGAAGLLPPLVLGQTAAAVYWLASPLIGFSRRTWIFGAASFPALAYNLAANAVLVPRFGAEGAAWAMATTGLLQCGIGSSLAHAAYHVPYEWRQLSKVLVLCGAAAALGLVVEAQPIALRLLWKSSVIAAVFGGLLAWRFFEAGELAAARRFVRTSLDRIGR